MNVFTMKGITLQLAYIISSVFEAIVYAGNFFKPTAHLHVDRC